MLGRWTRTKNAGSVSRPGLRGYSTEGWGENERQRRYVVWVVTVTVHGRWQEPRHMTSTGDGQLASPRWMQCAAPTFPFPQPRASLSLSLSLSLSSGLVIAVHARACCAKCHACRQVCTRRLAAASAWPNRGHAHHTAAAAATAAPTPIPRQAKQGQREARRGGRQTGHGTLYSHQRGNP